MGMTMFLSLKNGDFTPTLCSTYASKMIIKQDILSFYKLLTYKKVIFNNERANLLTLKFLTRTKHNIGS